MIPEPAPDYPDVADAESILLELAAVFFQNGEHPGPRPDRHSPNVEARYRALVEQIPAVVFMAYLDEGIGEAYVSPQIEESLGFSQAEWLEDPIRWYRQIHSDDKQRWSVEAAQMFLSGKPLRSAYRVLARDGHVIWFHCEAKMIRQVDGRPWFIHGVAFDITELKRTEQALQDERNVLSAILDTSGALIVVLEPNGGIVRFNRACEQTLGYTFAEVKGRKVWDLFLPSQESERFQALFDQLLEGSTIGDYENHWATRDGARRLIAWSATVLTGGDGVRYIIATGIDCTERKRLEKAILEISGHEQRRIGQDLHDGLGQHLTGIAFMSKALEQKLSDKSLPEAADAAKIVNLVNEAIHQTRDLARGLLPVSSQSYGLMSALQQWAGEVEDLFKIECRFECDDAVLVADDNTATHLYRIAQEAVHNAIKHGHARAVRIGLRAGEDRGELTVSDNGSGIPGLPPNHTGMDHTGMDHTGMDHTGMGQRIMKYRAGMIGGALTVEPGAGRGTVVTCVFPVRKKEGV